MEQAKSGEARLDIQGTLAVIRLGAPDEGLFVLSEKRMDSLARTLELLHTNTSVRGLVVTGGPQGFCAGADINIIREVKDSSRGERLSRRGQEIFEMLAELTCPTVAAVSGACVGGGCELALACKYRVGLDSPDTKIGLPEVKLGILPGFGGTQRLPRLVGLEHALSIILEGKVLTVDKARAYGLLDRLVPQAGDAAASHAALLSDAAEVALGRISVHRRPLSVREKFLTHTAIGRTVVSSMARRKVLSETKGHYPAPLQALESTVNGLGCKVKEQGYLDEARMLGRLIVSPECKSLTHIYFLTENAAKIGKSLLNKISPSMTVVGGGVMGAGIASSFLGRGFRVFVVEPVEEARAKALSHIEQSLQKRRSLTEQERSAARSRLTVTDDLTVSRDSELVIEAIVEDVEAKKQLFSRLEQFVSESAFFATNTSSLSLLEIAKDLAHPERCMGMHFFNPVEKMPLVELIRTAQTADRAIAYGAAYVQKLGKYPVVVKNVPGFLVNRILSPYVAEAAALLGQGVGINEIDKVAVAFGMPMGPLRLLDEIGLDVAYKVQGIMEAAYGERMKAPPILSQLLTAERWGKKGGHGFYIHEGKKVALDPSVYTLLGVPYRPGYNAVSKEEVQERLILSLVNESVRCLDEGVAGAPGEDAAGQIDLATVMGMGFPPFRGGLLHYCRSLGFKELERKLSSLFQRRGERFRPAPGIVERAKENP